MNHNFFQRILWKSVHGNVKSGPLRTFSWKSSNQQPNSTTETFWVVKTNVRLVKFLDCLKLKHLLLGLSEEELQLLVDSPKLFQDLLFLDSLRALSSLSLKEDRQTRIRLVERLQRLRSCLGQTRWDLNLLYTYLGNIYYEVTEVRLPIRKVKKFSGWVRNSSAVGSKRSSGITKPECEIFETLLFEELDYYPFLISKELDFQLLGLDAGTPLYSLLISHLENETELPDYLKKYLRFKQI